MDIHYSISKDLTLPRGYIAKINEDIEESRFPFKVDLVLEDQVASSYRARILSERKEI